MERTDILHIPVAQREPQIKPDRVLDDRRREAMSAVGELVHAGSLPRRAASRTRFRDIAFSTACLSWSASTSAMSAVYHGLMAPATEHHRLSLQQLPNENPRRP